METYHTYIAYFDSINSLEASGQCSGSVVHYSDPDDEIRWTCTNCKGCERHEDGEFTSEEDCLNSPCYSGTLNVLVECE